MSFFVELIFPGGLSNRIKTFKKFILVVKAQVIFRNQNPRQNCLTAYLLLTALSYNYFPTLQYLPIVQKTSN